MRKHININLKYSTTRRLHRIKFNQNIKTKLNNSKNKIEGGLRTKNFFKKSTAGKPLISIITVTYNCQNLLERTIKSVLNLSYDNIEFIIVDGRSNDNTINIINNYNDFIDYWIYQKDNGIYDAMNKGAKYSKGDAVFFLNAGDKLKNKEFLKLIKLFEKNKQIYGNDFVLCGNHTYTKGYPGFKYLERNFIPFLGRLPSHQSMLIPRKLQIQNKYDNKFPISADKDFKLRIYLKRVKYIIFNYIVCISLPGGKSQHIENHNYLINRTVETFSIFKKNYNFFWAFVYSIAFYTWNFRKIINKN